MTIANSPWQVASAQAASPTVTCNSSPAIFNTGRDAGTGGAAAPGSADANWESSGPFATPVLPATTAYSPAWVVGKSYFTWASSPSSDSNWISNETLANQANGLSGTWFYRYQFTMDATVDPAKFALAMDLYADNVVQDIFVNGVSQTGKTAGLPQNTDGSGFPDGHQASTALSHDWGAGMNSVVVEVVSSVVVSGPGFEGLQVELREPSVLCPIPTYSVHETVSSATAKLGDVLTYTTTVTNTGNYPAANATFTSDLSDVLADASYDNDASNGATLSGTTLAWAGPLAAGESKAITFSATVKSSSRSGAITASATPGVGGSCSPDSSGCAVTTALGAAPLLAATGVDSLNVELSGVLLVLVGVVLHMLRRPRRHGVSSLS